MDVFKCGKHFVEEGCSFGCQFLNAHHIGLVTLKKKAEGGFALWPMVGAPQVVGDKGQANWKHG